MIHVKSIVIENFKGIKRLACDFEDLTVLAGLNNSGKTSILQTVHFVVSALTWAKQANASNRWDARDSQRQVDLTEPLSMYGLGQPESLILSGHVGDVLIRADFMGDVPIELRIPRTDRPSFKVPVEESMRDGFDHRLSSWDIPHSEPLTPPGDLPTREEMLTGQGYLNQVRQGQGPRLWRNGLWWAVQNFGPEKYQPLASLVQRQFYGVGMRLPRLSAEDNRILIEYIEEDRGPFDISQSGGGLRSFISLARMLEVSSAEILLLDEPDAHLHASQQAVVFDLLMEAAQAGRQVILATHSPEVISRAPIESLRWIERGSGAAIKGSDAAILLERLGATPDLYIPISTHPDVIVYVEGKTDVPVIESLIRWCRRNHSQKLPSTLVIPHKEGRYDAVALQAIVRYTRSMKFQPRVVGIRDLDWEYGDFPSAASDVRKSEDYLLLTLQVKEMENLFCDAGLLHQVFEGRIDDEELMRILDEESNHNELVDDWRFQVTPRIRDRLPGKLDDSTREREADEKFQEWRADHRIRTRLVAGKALLRSVLGRVRREHTMWCSTNRMLDRIRSLSPDWAAIAKAIFPGVDWSVAAASPMPSELTGDKAGPLPSRES